MESRAFFERAMHEAILEARKGRWTACPNPTVGAVLVKDGQIVARGYHHRAGQPHAEIECLRDAESRGISPKGCTIVVTLEPCNHTGRTGPCSEALIRAGITRAVIGMRDPNPVAKGGAERLRNAGIDVIEGILEQECRDLVADFLAWTLDKRPFVLVKMASTIDGRIAARSGDSRWVSSEGSRAMVHDMRHGIGEAGGIILVGGETFRKDNPSLSARTDPLPARQPRACVLTSHLPAADLSPCHLLEERAGDTIFAVPDHLATSPAARALEQKGSCIIPVAQAGGHTDFAGLFRLFHTQGYRYILCEGGGRLALSLLESRTADCLLLHMSPKILGDNQAIPLFDGRSPLRMGEAIGLRPVRTEIREGDVHMLFMTDAGRR